MSDQPEVILQFAERILHADQAGGNAVGTALRHSVFGYLQGLCQDPSIFWEQLCSAPPGIRWPNWLQMSPRYAAFGWLQTPGAV